MRRKWIDQYISLLYSGALNHANQTKVNIRKNEICVTYQNTRCSYRFAGEVDPDFKYYYNRNGRYRVYKAATKKLQIELEESNCEV